MSARRLSTGLLAIGLALVVAPGLRSATPSLTPTREAHPACQEAPDNTVWWEDGSGVKCDSDGYVVEQYPEDTRPWNCAADGNGICGDGWQRWSEYDGHPDCWALVDETTVVNCRDGFVTTT